MMELDAVARVVAHGVARPGQFRPDTPGVPRPVEEMLFWMTRWALWAHTQPPIRRVQGWKFKDQVIWC